MLRLTTCFRALLPAYALVIAWLSLTPATGDGALWDKALHFCAYGGFALLTLPWSRGHASRLLFWGLGVFVYSGLLEVAQSAVPGRSMDGLDMVANGLGIAAGLCCGWALLQWSSGRVKRLLLGTAP